MAKMSEEMRAVLEEVTYWVLATADRDGMPNAVPIRWTKVLGDDKLMLVDNFMKKTIDNIDVNPKVSISVWKVKEKGSIGYQFKGAATIENSGPTFEEGKELLAKAGSNRNPKGVVIVRIDSIFCTSPGSEAGKRLA